MKLRAKVLKYEILRGAFERLSEVHVSLLLEAPTIDEATADRLMSGATVEIDLGEPEESPDAAKAP